MEFNELIKANGAKTVLYQTWGYKNGFNEFTKYEMYLKVKEQYEKVGNKIIVGVDAHNPKEFGIEEYNRALSIAKEWGLTLVEKIEF